MHNLAERTGSERNSKASDLVSADTPHGGFHRRLQKCGLPLPSPISATTFDMVKSH